MRSVITYAGNISSDYDLVIERFPSLNRPSRKYEKVSVPGRNGDIYFNQDAWNNYSQEYEVWSGGRNASAPDLWTNIFQWLYPEEQGTTVEDVLNLEVNGYHQLIDTYEPNTIRLAQFNEETDVENSWNNFGKSIIRFDCRPERFTSNAFTAISKTSSGGYVTNNGRPSKPCLKIYGSGEGTVTCNGYVITISSIPSYIYIDSDSQNCFKEISDANLNNLVTLTSGFPILDNGRNTITWTGGVTQVDVYPRWWNL